MDIEFISINDLIQKGHYISRLATAIEQVDIGLWDRFGRFVKANEEQKKEILDALASAQEALDQDVTDVELQEEYARGFPEHNMTISFNRYGWRADALPKFEELEANWIKANPWGGKKPPQLKIKLPNSSYGIYQLVRTLLKEIATEEEYKMLSTQNAKGISEFTDKLHKKDKSYTVSQETLTDILKKSGLR